MKAIKSKKKSCEMQKEMYDAFIEYFREYDPVFKDGKEAIKAMNDFLLWRSTHWIVPGKGKTPHELWLEDHEILPEMLVVHIDGFDDVKGVGILCDEKTSFYFCPQYSFIKKLFRGKYREINNFKEIIYDIIEEDDVIDTYFLKKVIVENKKRAVEVFHLAYPQIKTFKDLDETMRMIKKDWDKEPHARITPVKT
jgi:hypothetical protein